MTTQDLGPYRSTEIVIPKRSVWSWFRGLFRRQAKDPTVWTTPRNLGGIFLHIYDGRSKHVLEMDEHDLKRAARNVCRKDAKKDMPVRGRHDAIYVVPACVAEQTRDMIISCAEALD